MSLSEREQAVLRKELEKYGLEKFEHVYVEALEKAKEIFGKPFRPLKCAICGKDATDIIVPMPLHPADLEDDAKLLAALERQKKPPIPICGNHTDEEIKQKFPWLREDQKRKK